MLDPGPAIPAHIDAILKTAGDHIRWIVCTHSSRSFPGVAGHRRGNRCRGDRRVPGGRHVQDDTFVPSRELRPTTCWSRRNSACGLCTRRATSATILLFLEQEQMLFAGDHIMNGSTVVIVPPAVT